MPGTFPQIVQSRAQSLFWKSAKRQISDPAEVKMIVGPTKGENVLLPHVLYWQSNQHLTLPSARHREEAREG